MPTRVLKSLRPQADTLWAALARANASLAYLGFVFVYTRLAAPATAGQLFLWLGVATLACVLGGLGRSQFIYADPAAAWRQGRPWVLRQFITASCTWVALASAGLAAAFLATGMQAFDSVSWLPLVLLAGVTAVLVFLGEALRVTRQFAATVAINPGTSHLLLAAACLLAGHDGLTPGAALWGLVAVQAVLAATGLLLCLRRLAPARGDAAPPAGLAAVGWPVNRALLPYFLNAVPVVVLYQVDIVIVGVFFGPEPLAGYTLASRLAGGLSFVNSIAYVILPARVSELLAQGLKHEVGEQLRRFAKGLAGLGLLLVAALSVVILLGAVIPQRGPQALWGFYILAGAHVLNCGLGARSVVLQLSGHSRLQAVISWSFAALCGLALTLAAMSQQMVLVFAAVAACIVGQAVTEAWLLYRRLGISSVPGLADLR